jgi:hypothetical protein
LAENTDRKKTFGTSMHNRKVRVERILKENNMLGWICLEQTVASDGFVKMINLQHSQSVRNFLTSYVTISVSRTVLHGISQ